MLKTKIPPASRPTPPRERHIPRPPEQREQASPVRSKAFRAIALIVLALVTFATGYRAFEWQGAQTETAPEARPLASEEMGEDIGTWGLLGRSLLYGRVTTYDGAQYEGQLRWGGDEEAFWDHYFNGYKDTNPWATYVPVAELTEARSPMRVLGLDVPRGERRVNLGRPFMVRFGDIARIDAVDDGLWAALERGVTFAPKVRVTLRSGAMHDLDRLEAGDFDDGVQVWDGQRRAVHLGPRKIRSIEFFDLAEKNEHVAPPLAPTTGAHAGRLFGTVHTRQGAFTGFLQWNRERALGSDVLTGQTADGAFSAPFRAIRAITRQTRSSTRVALQDGREVVLIDAQSSGPAPRGVYVDDPRYGRVLVQWDALERVTFAEGGQGPTYADFAPGRSLSGRVTTRDGDVLAGRLVYDLDESESIETLDAPREGVDFTLPFGLVETLVLPGGGTSAAVRLRSGETLHLERKGDLGDANAGVLVFTPGQAHPDYVPWADVARIAFDGPKTESTASARE